LIVVDATELSQAIDKLAKSNVKSIGIFQTKSHDVVLHCAEHNQPRVLVKGEEV